MSGVGLSKDGYGMSVIPSATGKAPTSDSDNVGNICVAVDDGLALGKAPGSTKACLISMSVASSRKQATIDGALPFEICSKSRALTRHLGRRGFGGCSDKLCT